MARTTVTFYPDIGNAQFYYDGHTYHGNSIPTDFVPPHLTNEIKDDWNGPYKVGNDQCILAGKIGENGFYGFCFPAIIPFKIGEGVEFGFYGSPRIIKITMQVRRGMNVRGTPSSNAYDNETYYYGPQKSGLWYALHDSDELKNSFLSRTEYLGYEIDKEHRIRRGGIQLRKDDAVEESSPDMLPAPDEAFVERSFSFYVPTANANPPTFVQNIEPNKTYYLYFWGYDSLYSTLTEINLSTLKLSITYENGAQITKDKTTTAVVPYVYSNGKWSLAQLYQYNSEKNQQNEEPGWLTCYQKYPITLETT